MRPNGLIRQQTYHGRLQLLYLMRFHPFRVQTWRLASPEPQNRPEDVVSNNTEDFWTTGSLGIVERFRLFDRTDQVSCNI